MQSTSPSDNLLDPPHETKHTPLWQIACLIFAIVFGPALIAAVFSIIR